MNETLLTISLFIIVVCNLGVLWLYWRIFQWTRTPHDIYALNHLMLERLANASKRQRNIHHTVRQEGLKTRKDIQEVKTRLTWSRKRELVDAKQEGVQS